MAAENMHHEWGVKYIDLDDQEGIHWGYLHDPRLPTDDGEEPLIEADGTLYFTDDAVNVVAVTRRLVTDHVWEPFESEPN